VELRTSTTVLHLGQFVVPLLSNGHPQQFFIWVSLLSTCGAKGIHNSSSSGSVHCPLVEQRASTTVLHLGLHSCSFCFRPGDVAHLQFMVRLHVVAGLPLLICQRSYFDKVISKYKKLCKQHCFTDLEVFQFLSFDELVEH